ncbi:MAG: hypothetical protein QXL88_02445 [Candidatus Pacearchaeota archaeon]
MDRKTNLKLIWKNYNSVYLTNSNTVIKIFKGAGPYKTERDVYLELNNILSPLCPKLLNYDDKKRMLEISYVEDDGSLCKEPLSFFFNILKILPKSLECLKNFYIKRDLMKEAIKAGLLNLIGDIEKICYSVKPYEKKFVHGDFRINNLRKKGLEVKLIDFEGSCIGDRNLDYSYLFWSMYAHDRDPKKFLEEVCLEKDFILENFRYYSCFFLVRLLNNPRFKEKNKAFNLLLKTINFM